MKCDDCIHKFVCYRIESVSTTYTDNSGVSKHDKRIGPWIITNNDIVDCFNCGARLRSEDKA